MLLAYIEYLDRPKKLVDSSCSLYSVVYSILLCVMPASNNHLNKKDVDNIFSDSDLEIHAVAGLLKTFFRELPAPLIPASVIENFNDTEGGLANVSPLIPAPTFLSFLVCLLLTSIAISHSVR